ncbi:MAG: GNAT family N-acetyltransferase, partial [Microbacterium sp.]
AIACMIVRKGHRGRGLTYPLVAAAVEHARARGAAAVEGYPLLTGGSQVIWDELNVGAVGPFTAAGFREITHPTKRRVVMRIDL